MKAKNQDQDTDQARGTPVPARFTVPKMIQGNGLGLDLLGIAGLGHAKNQNWGTVQDQLPNQ
jgi:hypothetical protein